MVSRLEKFCNGKLFNWVNSKDGFAIAKGKNVRAWRVLEFLVPILYLEMPTWVTITIGNTIFGALLEERKVDKVLVIKDVVRSLLTGWGSQSQLLLAPMSSTSTTM